MPVVSSTSLFVLLDEPYHDNSTPIAVFPSREAAEAYLNGQTKKGVKRLLWGQVNPQPGDWYEARVGEASYTITEIPFYSEPE